MNRFNGSKEDLNEVNKIYVISITDFLDTYKVESKQKFKIVSNYLNNWLKKKILPNINNGNNQKL